MTSNRLFSLLREALSIGRPDFEWFELQRQVPIGSMAIRGGRNILKNFLSYRKLCSYAQRKLLPTIDWKLQIPEPEYNTEYLCNPANRDEIHDNISHRKGVGDIDKVLKLSSLPEAHSELLNELGKIPNKTAPGIFEYGNEPKILSECGVKRTFDFEPLPFDKLAKSLQLIRIEDLSPLAGEKSYILLGDLAQLEEALIQYTVSKLLKNGYKLVSVPDILPTKVIERCGLIVDGERTLVYGLDSCYGDDFSLSGTAEMALASKLIDSEIAASEMPIKIAAVSRCYRAEISNLAEERGLYRVHQFTKVEMFACSIPEASSQLMEELRIIQQELFSSLGLNYKVLDMPAHELGAPAYRKFDIEGWLPGRQSYGELSSCSNCTDYQSRRLNIKYKSEDGELLHVHTLNGTACAIPRMLIAICETHQTKNGEIKIPDKLVPYMRGKTVIGKQPIAKMRDYKYKQKGLNK